MAKTNCGTCNSAGHRNEHYPSPYGVMLGNSIQCNRGCTCKHTGGGYIGPNGERISTGAMIEMVGGLPSNNWLINNGYTNIPHTYTCHPKRAQQNRDRHLNASGFLGTGVSGFKVIWWSLGALLLLVVVGKGIKVYKQAKS